MAIKHFKASGFLTNGFGNPLAGQISLYDDRMTEATVSLATEDREVPGIIDGSDIIQTIDAYQTKATYTFTTSTESIDSGLLALMFGESWQQTPSFSAPAIKRSVIPAVAPFEIIDTDIASTAGIADVQVLISENGIWGRIRPLSIVTTGAPTIDQVRLDAATSKLIFAAGNANAPIKYAVNKTYANQYSLGVQPTAKLLDDLKFVGMVSTTRKEDILMVIPRLGRQGGWELGVGASSKIDLSFKALVSGSNRSPVQFLQLLT